MAPFFKPKRLPHAAKPAASFATLGRRITAWTSNLLATAVVLVLALGIGRQLIAWYRVEPEAAHSAPLDMTAGSLDLSGADGKPLELEFGSLAHQLQRRVVHGSWRDARQALIADCREHLADRPLGVTPAESRLLARVRANDSGVSRRWRRNLFRARGRSAGGGHAVDAGQAIGRRARRPARRVGRFAWRDRATRGSLGIGDPRGRGSLASLCGPCFGGRRRGQRRTSAARLGVRSEFAAQRRLAAELDPATAWRSNHAGDFRRERRGVIGDRRPGFARPMDSLLPRGARRPRLGGEWSLVVRRAGRVAGTFRASPTERSRDDRYSNHARWPRQPDGLHLGGSRRHSNSE